MRNLFRRLRQWLFPQPTYVVIYDVGDPTEEVQEYYYGYFSSIDEARLMYGSLSHGQRDYHNAYVCRIVEPIK